jgi:hypothetical protein
MAQRGDLIALLFLQSLDSLCPWDSRACHLSARRGDLQMLQWGCWHVQWLLQQEQVR